MRQEHCRILASGTLASGHCLVEVDCTPLAQPARAGQFLMLRGGESLADPLRHPVFFSRGGRVGQLLFPIEEPWEMRLASLLPEETIDALGPLGQPFSLRPGANQMLVLALAEPVAPALAAANWAQRQGLAVSLALARPQWSCLTDLLPRSVECGVVAASGLASLADGLRWADQVLAIATSEQVGQVADAIVECRLGLSPGFASVLLASDFACGVGACGACTASLGRHHFTVCNDGPVFDLALLVE